ncbi:alpha/beta hydrolase-fold protein, partial [Streptomyces sp. NPDC057654]|uniref:alpha/beta hydrolase-fold protein n=1 Tax=Streptomyces sp. NPDC057654 TaxID=3346196 RepID=UPI0036A4B2F9
ARTVLAGQSLGGLMAAHAAVRAPHRFGNALAQSGSFWWPDGPDAEWLTRVIATAEEGRLPVRFHLSAGEQEWVLLPANRRLRDTLREGGHDVRYREFNGGHDYLCWRTELAEGLVHLLGT